MLSWTKELSIKGDDLGTYTMIDGSSLKECDINVNKGDIDLIFFDKKVRPRINRLFKKVTNVNGVYKIGKKDVLLSLSTRKGRIKVNH